jgi:phosphate transport system substrate-binding protein
MKSVWKFLIAAASALSLAASVTACTRPSERAKGDGTGEIVITGSDTMVHLVSAWAEAYMEEHPGVNISVTGGGTGVGIAALKNGSTDVAMASRDIKPEEAQKIRAAGHDFVEHAVGLDGIAVVVNPQNPITELTMNQLERLFTGEAKSWAEVGGENQKVLIVSRESSSGTFVFFQEHVLNKKNYSVDAMLLPATSAIVQTIGSDKWNIGYVGLGYEENARDKVKAVAVKKDESSPAVMPSVDSIKDGSYPIARKLFLYISSDAPLLAQDFVAFTQSAAGQEIVVENGYVPIN